ncbi:hypothetical protein [Nocardiopsis ansamitocini]|uniref:Uncharacterized protein n=1 Tax=Nocardiopsis ansamitocini TaxID=1670832 RepID=A0A9W6UJ10_9ACTN|nr:hypothetical protein [Nocardiopsis ansamitocini]GLU50461.1 hypothetical protein Nans01_48120 [Nocardiopsis ansamitocini]
MATNNDGLAVSPAEMERMGQELRAPGDMMLELTEQTNRQVEALGEPWGREGDIAKAAKENLVPMLKMFNELGPTLAKAFYHAADETVKSARMFQASDEAAQESAQDFLRPIGDYDSNYNPNDHGNYGGRHGTK